MFQYSLAVQVTRDNCRCAVCSPSALVAFGLGVLVEPIIWVAPEDRVVGSDPGEESPTVRTGFGIVVVSTQLLE